MNNISPQSIKEKLSNDLSSIMSFYYQNEDNKSSLNQIINVEVYNNVSHKNKIGMPDEINEVTISVESDDESFENDNDE